MIEFERILALSLVAVAIIAVPGPSVLFVVSRGVTLGRRAALATVAGNEVGLIVQVTAVAIGLGAIVETSIVVYTVLKFVGATYLVYLGVQAIRHRGELATSIDRPATRLPTRRIFLDGFVVGVRIRTASCFLPRSSRSSPTLQPQVLHCSCSCSV